ncbi:MAG: class I SAM-dependent methyltransferase, partial [Bdellovibrionales bacterium]|nr:class I SAM-dependent methyltransferase [Bdellovibrionales bacterium]
MQRRSKLASGFTSFRIFDSVGDGIEGLAIDRYDRVLICQVLSQFRQELEVELSLDLETLAKLTNTETIYLRIRNPSAEKLSSQVIECIFGSPKASFTISESDLAFLIKPEEHLNAGLFLDTRNIRSRLRNISLGKRVLNTFCFSGTLGVAAAVGGASEVVQLDSSKSALNWARENYHLNAENIKANIRYIPDHVPRFLEKEIRRIQNGRPSFDIVVLDPPAFGRA